MNRQAGEVGTAGHSVFGVVHLLTIPRDCQQPAALVRAEISRHHPPAIVVRVDGESEAETLAALAERLPQIVVDYRWQLRVDDDVPDLVGERRPRDAEQTGPEPAGA